jgi:ElaB/YqjD/DUF883 family membrane-anchored ribosome-binding protein
MDTTANNFSKQGQALADSAADKVQNGIRHAQRASGDVGDALSNKVEDLRSEAGQRARDMAQRTRDGLSDAADAIVSYTKENPAKALAIAAAAGALLYGLVKMVQTARD